MAPADPDISVLVVDDERSNVESLERIFAREGMRVLVATDAKHALEVLRTHRVHVVLTDLMMPGTTGLELLRAVKQVAPDVEVVLMTAYGTVESAVSSSCFPAMVVGCQAGPRRNTSRRAPSAPNEPHSRPLIR